MIWPWSKSDGHYEAIYGRRRLRACRELGLKVRANVQDIDDATALLAKGLENAARRNLSFYEKARFAEAIQAAGHDASTTKQVLNLSASGLSHLTKITQNVPRSIGDLIGAAPKSGRPKWTQLAEMFSGKKLSEKSAAQVLERVGSEAGSDERLEQLLMVGVKREARQVAATGSVSPVEGVTIKSGKGSVSMSIKRGGGNAAFAEWLDENLAEIIKRSYAEFTTVNSQDEK